MSHFRCVRRFLAVLALAGLLFTACDGLERPPVVRAISPGDGVTVWQVSFWFNNEPSGEHSTWGRLVVDPAQVEEATGIREGRLNVVTEGGWAVCNAPVLPGNEPPYAIYFDLGLEDAPRELQEIILYMAVSDQALSLPDEERDPIPWPVLRWDYAAEGVADKPSTILDIVPPPLVRLLSVPVFVALELSAWYQSDTNEQCAHNQCFPMAIANALAYLDDRGVATLAHTHAMGLKGDSTLVGQLDSYTGRPATSRIVGSGLWFTPAVEGTFEYLFATGLAALTHRHLDDGYGTAPSQSLPAGNFTHSTITTIDEGPVATFEWIFERIKAGAGVVAVMQYASGGGHAVRVTAAGRDDAGKEWVRYSHDAFQTTANPASDSLGLENVLVELEDLDGDGTLNFGTLSRELVFVWAFR